MKLSGHSFRLRSHGGWVDGMGWDGCCVLMAPIGLRVLETLTPGPDCVVERGQACAEIYLWMEWGIKNCFCFSFFGGAAPKLRIACERIE